MAKLLGIYKSYSVFINGRLNRLLAGDVGIAGNFNMLRVSQDLIPNQSM